MSLPRTLLGLLDPEPAHGYDLKRSYDLHFGSDRPVAYGQVYAALARMLSHGLIEVAGVEAGDGPDRKRYAITGAGVTELREWLGTPEPPTNYLQSTLYTKVVLALLTTGDAAGLLDTQRTAHLQQMRELTRRKQGGDFATQLICDHALMHLEADLRWLEVTAARMAGLKAEVGR